MPRPFPPWVPHMQATVPPSFSVSIVSMHFDRAKPSKPASRLLSGQCQLYTQTLHQNLGTTSAGGNCCWSGTYPHSHYVVYADTQKHRHIHPYCTPHVFQVTMQTYDMASSAGGDTQGATFEQVAGSVCLEVYRETLRGVVTACRRYKDELLESCLELLLSAPSSVMTIHVSLLLSGIADRKLQLISVEPPAIPFYCLCLCQSVPVSVPVPVPVPLSVSVPGSQVSMAGQTCSHVRSQYPTASQVSSAHHACITALCPLHRWIACKTIEITVLWAVEWNNVMAYVHEVFIKHVQQRQIYIKA